MILDKPEGESYGRWGAPVTSYLVTVSASYWAPDPLKEGLCGLGTRVPGSLCQRVLNEAQTYCVQS